jgi:hypothetical protein
VGGGGGGCREGVNLAKTSANARFRGGAGKRKPQPSKTSAHARLREAWVVVLARGRYNPRKRAVTLVFGGLWVVVVMEGSTYPKTSVSARFRVLWLPVRGHNPRKRARRLVFGGGGVVSGGS